MRQFSTFPEAFNEITRDLAEMGTEIKTKTMQDKDIEGNKDFTTLELQHYTYRVSKPALADIPASHPWVELELGERIAGAEGKAVNPGKAWKSRPEVWEEFLNDSGQFAYTYPIRLSSHSQVRNVIERLKIDKFSRQLYISMWRPMDSLYLGTNRVPCSLGWLVQYRNEALDMIYYMRSCDRFTHFYNDVYLAHALQCYIASEALLPVGQFAHSMASFHVYAKDVGNVF